jgi:guanine deaminase
VTLFRGTVLDTPHDPFTGGALRADADAGLLVRDGAVAERGPFPELARRHPGEDVVALPDGLLLPGFVDTHVHFPQVRAMGGLGMPLLDWLEKCALPEEARLADGSYARAVAADFVSGLTQAGTTTALVFGAHFAPAVDALFTAAAQTGTRVTSGLVVSDRLLREDLLTTPQRAYDEGMALARRWHGVGRNRYAVTPRFSLSCGNELLDACGSLLRDVPGAWFTSHVNENALEIAAVAELFEGSVYVNTYDRHGLIGRRSVLAHNVHPTDDELALLCTRGASIAHCPTSNAALGSGIFSLARHVAAGVRVALGSDVGAGTGFSMLKEGLQAYFLQQLLGEAGQRLTPAHLLHLATAAGADALGLGDEVGDLGVGKRFDAVWVRPRPGTTLDVALRTAAGPEDALARAFALASPADVHTVWIDGERLHTEHRFDEAIPRWLAAGPVGGGGPGLS